MENLTNNESVIYQMYLKSEYVNEQGFNVFESEYNIVSDGILSYLEIKIAKEMLCAKGILTEFINERDITSYYLSPIIIN